MYGKKKMTDLEKKAKLSALKDANSMASDMMKDAMCGFNQPKKDSPELKKHVKDMSDESGIDYANDAKQIQDPQHYGNVIGRHISDEEIDAETKPSTYDLDSVNVELERLMKSKSKRK